MNLMEIAFQTIAYAGDGRSYAMQAIQQARQGRISEAEELLKQADSSLAEAHKIQADLLWKEANNEKCEFSLMLMHSQDHLMNALTVCDLAKEIIELWKEKNK